MRIVARKSGAKQAIMVALQAILNPQEEVIFPAPYWVSYPEMAKMIGAVPVPVPPEDGSFYPRLEDIERYVTSYTKAVIINSPNNPTGAMYPEQFIAEIVAFCEKRGLFLIMDDIYHRLVFDGKRPISYYKLSNAWGNKEEYWMKYDALGARYIENFKLFAGECPDEVVKAGPKRLGK